ncbi:hypothetical protein MNV49_005086 [Pseudohyphozyma bogoriensis]|nr:hypothetical protein MNV49_005086 [Pseudohyphozyma bogoriensis]
MDAQRRAYFYSPSTQDSRWEKPSGLTDEQIAQLPGAHLLAASAPGPTPATGGKPDKVRSSHLLVKHRDSRRPSSWKEQNITRSKEEAIEILRGHQKTLLDAGDLSSAFAALARTESDCSSQRDGGDLGWFGPRQMQKPFEDATYGTPIGQMSDIISTDSGVHLILRTEKGGNHNSPPKVLASSSTPKPPKDVLGSLGNLGQAYAGAQRRLIVSDVHGTLIPFDKHGQAGRCLTEEERHPLRALAADPKNVFWINTLGVLQFVAWQIGVGLRFVDRSGNYGGANGVAVGVIKQPWEAVLEEYVAGGMREYVDKNGQALVTFKPWPHADCVALSRSTMNDRKVYIFELSSQFVDKVEEDLMDALRDHSRQYHWPDRNGELEPMIKIIKKAEGRRQLVVGGYFDKGAVIPFASFYDSYAPGFDCIITLGDEESDNWMMQKANEMEYAEEVERHPEQWDTDVDDRQVNPCLVGHVFNIQVASRRSWSEKKGKYRELTERNHFLAGGVPDVHRLLSQLADISTEQHLASQMGGLSV